MRALLVAPFLCALGACVVQPRVQSAAERPQEPRLEAERAVMADGASLPLEAWLPPAGEPRAIVVAVHGLNDYSESLAGAGEYLAERGYAVYAFDQRGFGATEQRGIWAGADVLADDVWQVAVLVRGRHPELPIYGLGESMGGAVVLHALRRHPDGWLDAAVLLAPAVWSRREMPWYQTMPLRVLAHSWRGLELSGRSTGRKPSDDPDVLRALREDPLRLKKTRVDALWGLADLMDAVTAEPPAVRLPLLVMYGGHDEIMPRAPVCTWLATLPPDAPWQLGFYSDGWHLLTRSTVAPTVLADLAAWYGEPGARLPSGQDSRGSLDLVCASPPPSGRGAAAVAK